MGRENKMTFEDKILEEVRRSVHESIVTNLTKYNGAMHKACDIAVADHQEAIHGMLSNAIAELIGTTDFKEAINKALKQKMAKVLVGKFGGELESTINKLKADPSTRAKMVLAVDNVINELTN